MTEPDYLAQMEQEAAERKRRQGAPKVPLKAPTGTPSPSLWSRFKTTARSAWNDAVARQGGFGFSDETKHALQMDKPVTTSAAHAILRPVQKAAEAGFGVLQGGMAAVETAAELADKATDATGLNEALSVDGNEFQPGTAVMALMEAFPMAGAGTTRGAMGATRATETGITRLPFRAAAIRQRVGKPVQLKALPEAAPLEAPKVPVKAAPEAAAAPKPVAEPTAEPTAAMAVEAPTPTLTEKLTPEPGALLHPEEWKGDGESVRRVVQERIGKLSEAEIDAMAARIDDAEASGAVIDDPHYRSALNVIVNEPDLPLEKRIAVLNALEESTQELAERAGAGPKTFGEMEQEFRKIVANGMTREELLEMEALHEGTEYRTRVGQNVMVASGIKFIRAREQMLADMKAGVTDARDRAMTVINDAVADYVVGKKMVAGTGRALGALRQEAGLAIKEVADDVLSITDPKHLEGRIKEALEELGDEDFVELLGRLKTGEDLESVVETLTNPEVAKDMSNWRRVLNSVSMALRSNALTPATALFNGASIAIGTGFRQLSRRWGARRLAGRGLLTDAEALRIEADIVAAVRWDAARTGFNAMMANIKWEFWGDVERIAGVGWGSGKVRAAAKGKRGAMALESRRSGKLREFSDDPRARVTDVDGFNARMASLQTGGGFAGLWAHAMRAGAVTLNTVDAASAASMRLFIGAMDEFGRNLTTTQERYAYTARFAFREGHDLGLHGEELRAYTVDRARELAERPSADLVREAEEFLLTGEDMSPELQYLLGRDKTVERISDHVLFNDGPQTIVGRKSAEMAEMVDTAAGLFLFRGALLPYIRTPIRLFERGLVTDTPWGKASQEVRDIIAKGGPEAAIVEARMEISGMALAAGFAAGLAELMVFTDGGWDNTHGLGGGSPGRIQIGDAYFEVNRLDPLALTLAIGGIMGQALRESGADLSGYDTEQAWATATEIAFHGLGDAFLSKSYLTGLRDFSNIVFSRDVDTTAARAEQLAAGVASRLIPLAGTSRTANDTIRGDAPDTVGMVATLMRNVPGGGLLLASRRDVLGNSIDGRTLGISLGLGKGVTPVVERLRELAIDVPDIKLADPSGFKMTGEQLNELRRIRGHEALNSEYETLDEALMTLFESEDFRFAPEKSQKRDMVLEVIRSFNEPARAILEERDEQFRSNRIANKAFKAYMRGSDDEPRMSRKDALEAVLEDAASDGLPEPDVG